MAAADKDKIIRYYRGTSGEETAVRLVDLAGQALKSQKFRLSGFLDPFGQEIAETVAANFPSLRADFYGGYQGAERVRALLICNDFGGNPGYDLSLVKASWGASLTRLSHRDVLGAVMGSGINREMVGDIIVTGEWAKIICDKKMADFLLNNLTYIGSAKVICEPDDLSSLAPKEEKVKEIKATVASLRIDSVAAAGFGTSRSKAAADIEADKLKLNWQPVKNAAQAVKAGDTISLRGRGRLEVAEITGLTKKGRTGVLLRRYM